MQLGPLAEEAQRSDRQLALQGIASVDDDLRLVLAVARMEVRRRVIVAVHRDDDPVERTNPGHQLHRLSVQLVLG